MPCLSCWTKRRQVEAPQKRLVRWTHSKEYISSLISIGDQFRLPYLLEIRPSSEFNYQAASSKLVNLNIGSASAPLMSFVTPADVIVANDFGDDEAFGGHQGQLLKLAGWVDVDSKLSVSGLFAAFIVQAKRQGWLRRRCCNVPPKT